MTTQAPVRPSRRGLVLAVVVAAVLLAGAVALTLVLNQQPSLVPVAVATS